MANDIEEDEEGYLKPKEIQENMYDVAGAPEDGGYDLTPGTDTNNEENDTSDYDLAENTEDCGTGDYDKKTDELIAPHEISPNLPLSYNITELAQLHFSLEFPLV